MDAEERFQKMIANPNSVRCKDCSGKMNYRGSGVYICEKCGSQYLSDFGKVKKYLTENGPCNAQVLEENTGVSHKTISRYIREGRIEPIRKPPYESDDK